MKAWILERYSKTGLLRLGEVSEPEPRDDEVLVKIRASGVNALDVKIAKGEFKVLLPYRTPFVLGHDVAGVVTRVGSKVRDFKPGDEVYSRPDDHRIGAFAEFIAIKEGSLAHKPKSLTMEEAASIPLVGLTAWQALVERANLKKGQRVFIQAGSGGVGTIAIQMAKALGAYVATTTSTANVDWVKDLGADLVIDYKKDSMENMLKDYDLVIHCQDDKTLMKSLAVLKPGGMLISISGPPDPSFGKEIKAPGLLRLVMGFLSSGVRKEAKRRGVNYSFLFMKASGSQLKKITTLIDAGAIRPVVHRVFPFDLTQDALAHVAEGRTKGKVVVKNEENAVETSANGVFRKTH